VTLGIQAKEFHLGFIRPENLVSYGLSVYGPFGKFQAGCHVYFTEKCPFFVTSLTRTMHNAHSLLMGFDLLVLPSDLFMSLRERGLCIMFTFCQDMLLLAIRDPMRGEERVWYRST
jgi:hypothetical protein